MHRLASCALLLLAGCMHRDLSPADLAAYDRLTSGLSSVVGDYRTDAARMSSASDCAAAAERYFARVRPEVEGLRPLAGEIDDHMMSGDMRCGMDAITGEVDRHRRAACASADPEANRTEALRHCDVMQRYADHMRMRGAEAHAMGSGMGMTSCCGSHADGGWMMADGGMMGWDHEMPGCPAR